MPTKREQQLQCADVMNWLIVEMEALGPLIAESGASKELTVFRKAIEILEGIVISLENEDKEDE